MASGEGSDDDLEFQEGDINRFVVNGTLAIDFSNRIQKVAKMDFNTNSRSRGRFTRMVIYVNLDKPLVLQVLVNSMLQKVEYEALPTICFSYKKYGHTKEIYPSKEQSSTKMKERMESALDKAEDGE
ncbi:hypothetical protein Gotri_019239 [Gossypium trilobum]|uniref:Uncharacterized protein n=1 Tax=Gossypium trilobum TaxID=34281 RepID=A0A7J9ECL3_9ROSI|nr:hypothetical protein [Gossypium trilobum]